MVNYKKQNILQIVKLVLMGVTVPQAYIFNINTFIFNYFAYLEGIMNRLESLKLNCRPGENIVDFCTVILVDADHLEISGAFNPDNLGIIACIFEKTYDPRFHIWENER